MSGRPFRSFASNAAAARWYARRGAPGPTRSFAVLSNAERIYAYRLRVAAHVNADPIGYHSRAVRGLEIIHTRSS